MVENIYTVGNESTQNVGAKLNFNSSDSHEETLAKNDSPFENSQIDLLKKSKKRYKILNNAFSLKEVLDRLGYGLGAHQWVTIFFFISGAGAFLVGLINAIRDVLGDFISSFINDYSKVRTLSKGILSFAGIFFGFSFLGIVLGIRLHSIPIYVFSVLFGSIGIVTYGQIYVSLLNQQIKHERKSEFLKEIAHYGLLITAGAFLVSGWLLQKIPLGTTVSFAGFTIPITGYFLTFELTAIMFILSGFILSNIPTIDKTSQAYPFNHFLKEYFHSLKSSRHLLFSNSTMKLLFFASLFVSVVQSIGASFYGYYIYELFKGFYFGGFLNVAIIFGVGILASFLGSSFTRFVQKKVGLAPMFVFGSLLLSLLPLILLTNKSFYPVLVAASLAIIGASILGVAQGLLTRKLLSLSQRKSFYKSLRSLSAIPFLILAGILAWIAGAYSFELVFKIIIGILIIIVVPIYFCLVLKSNKQEKF